MTKTELLGFLSNKLQDFPDPALEAALQDPLGLNAGLLALLERAGSQPGELSAQSYGPRVAMVILAAEREPQAFEPLLNLLTLPAELVDHVLGDSLEYLLPRALATTVAGQLEGRVEALMQQVLNQDRYDYCRIAALRALKVLMLQGELGRETLIAFYHKLFAKLPKRLEAFPWDLLIREINEIHPAELEQDMRHIFAAGLVNPYFVRQEHMEVDLSKHPEAHLEAARLKIENRLIEDVETELRRFARYADI